MTSAIRRRELANIIAELRIAGLRAQLEKARALRRSVIAAANEGPDVEA